MGNSKSTTASKENGTEGAAARVETKKWSLTSSSSSKTPSVVLLYLQWSDEAVPHALVYFNPKKAVPQHKKTQNAGRLELMRGIASNKVKMLEGVVHFVKEAAVWDGEVKALDNQYFDMWYCQGSGVKALKVGDSVSVSKIGALAVMPHNNSSFNGVQKIDVGRFVNTATREGAAWKH